MPMKKSLITPLFAAVTIIFTTVCSSSCTYEEPVIVIEGGEVPEPPEEPVSVPSQDEADAAAAETIDAENADEKLDDLLETIDG
jgi:hypothetical protein